MKTNETETLRGENSYSTERRRAWFWGHGVQHHQLLQRSFSLSERPRKSVRPPWIPEYFKVELTVAKIFGVLALLIPSGGASAAGC